MKKVGKREPAILFGMLAVLYHLSNRITRRQ